MPRTYHQKVCISGKGYHRLNDARILSTWKDKDDLDEQCYVMDWINNRGRYQSSGWQRSLEKDCLYINLYSPFHMVETTTKKNNQKTFTAYYYTLWQWYNLSRNFLRRRASWTLGKSKLNSSWHWATTCISPVLNNCMKSLFITKSSDLNWYWYSLWCDQPS